MSKWNIVLVLFFCCFTSLIYAKKQQVQPKEPKVKLEDLETFTPSLSQTLEPKEELEELETFTPSLSQTLHDSSQMKNQIKRQLAQELDENPENHITDKNDKSSFENYLQGEVALFGDVTVGISKREEENL